MTMLTYKNIAIIWDKGSYSFNYQFGGKKEKARENQVCLFEMSSIHFFDKNGHDIQTEQI
jgi:hypothetical protein